MAHRRTRKRDAKKAQEIRRVLARHNPRSAEEVLRHFRAKHAPSLGYVYEIASEEGHQFSARKSGAADTGRAGMGGVDLTVAGTEHEHLDLTYGDPVDDVTVAAANTTPTSIGRHTMGEWTDYLRNEFPSQRAAALADEAAGLRTSKYYTDTYNDTLLHRREELRDSRRALLDTLKQGWYALGHGRADLGWDNPTVRELAEVLAEVMQDTGLANHARRIRAALGGSDVGRREWQQRLVVDKNHHLFDDGEWVVEPDRWVFHDPLSRVYGDTHMYHGGMRIQ